MSPLERDEEGRPTRVVRIDPNAAPHGLNETLRDVQAQPRPTGSSSEPGLDPVEAVEILSCLSAGTPSPWSRTAMSASSSSELSVTTIGESAGEYFMALDRRFATTWATRIGSAWTLTFRRGPTIWIGRVG